MPQSPPSIPPRRSSIVNASKRNRSPLEDADDIKIKIQHLNDDIKKVVKTLISHGSYNSSFWKKSKSIASMRKEVAILTRKLPLSTFRNENPALSSYESWEESAQAADLNEQIKSFELDERKFAEQERRAMLDPNALDCDKRGWLESFTTSTMGLGIRHTGHGKRDTTARDRFKSSLIADYQSKHPDERRDLLWCPVHHKYQPPGAVTAAHIFARQHGQKMMTSVFGTVDELFSSKNGLIISKDVETRFDKGLILFVPDVPNEPSLAAMSLWHNSEPKSYKVRVTNPEHPLMQLYADTSKVPWKNLDDKKLVFKGNARPRARYLYWHYCVAILRRSWNIKSQEHGMKDQFGRPFWGTRGRYVKKNMIESFVMELGHDYDALLEGADEDEDIDVVPQEEQDLGILVANHQIRLSDRTKNGESDDDDDDDDGDDDDDDDDDVEYEVTRIIRLSESLNHST